MFIECTLLLTITRGKGASFRYQSIVAVRHFLCIFLTNFLKTARSAPESSQHTWVQKSEERCSGEEAESVLSKGPGLQVCSQDLNPSIVRTFRLFHLSILTLRVDNLEGRVLISNTSFVRSQVAKIVKNLPAVPETLIRSLGREDALEKGMATHSVFLPGESHEQRSLAGYSPQDHKESGRTEQLILNNF